MKAGKVLSLPSRSWCLPNGNQSGGKPHFPWMIEEKATVNTASPIFGNQARRPNHAPYKIIAEGLPRKIAAESKRAGIRDLQ
jgi:hypothetical protein